MHINSQDALQAFRTEVRAWLAREAPKFSPPPLASEAEVVACIRKWLAAKADACYVGFTAPAEYGGRGTGWAERLIFEEEESRYPIAQIPVAYGRGNSMSVIVAHGTPETKREFIRPTLRGEYIWCQMFSEPSAGNDVAALRTRAVRQGDGWLVNGQKTWITGAHMADWGMLVVRTDPTVPKHKGLTYFLVGMKSPGIEVRPLKQLTGRANFNEVFFTDVFIPDRCRVGSLNGGWEVVLTTLMAERPNAISSGGIAWGGEVLNEVVRLARRVATTGVEQVVERMTKALTQGAVPGPEGTITKFVWTRSLQEMSLLGLEIAGPVGMQMDPEDKDLAWIQERALGAAGFRLAGGTDDISRSIIAERVLGLPPDPRVDKDIPFNQLPVGV
jgi:alkylation response protein AidB-like acyl-CoA dehydrogenase